MTFHVRGVGWVYTGADLLPRVHRPGTVPEDYEEHQTRMALYRERLREERERASAPPPPWPAPEVPMRVVEPGAAPRAVARLLGALRGAGWRTVLTYARGTLTPARDGHTGQGAERRRKHYPAVVVGSWAVRAAHGGRRAVAIWHERGGKVSAQGVLLFGDSPARWVGIKEFEGGI